MEQQTVMSLAEGSEELFVISWPQDVPPDEASHGLALVVMRRAGGAILAVPLGVFPMDSVMAGASAAEDADLGPGTVLSVPGVKEEDKQIHLLGSDLEVLVIDVSDDVLGLLVPVADSVFGPSEIMGYGDDPAYLPDVATLVKFTKEWIEVSSAQRVQFYSADEGNVAEAAGQTKPKQKAKAKVAEKAKSMSPAMKTAAHIQNLASLLPTMATQLNAIQAEQKRMQNAMAMVPMSPPPRGGQSPVTMPVQDFAKMMGVPPRTKAMVFGNPKPPPLPRQGSLVLDTNLTAQEQAEEKDLVEPAIQEELAFQDPLALAMLEQSRALTSLVNHLQGGGDPLIDGQGYASGTSSRGAQGRERLQRELTARSGSFFLTVMQNAFRRLKPATPVPTTLEDLAGTDFAMLQYLERYGNYAGARDIGVIQYALSFIVDAAVKGDMDGVREHLGLTVLALEQAAQDQGRWDMAFLLLLVDEAPQTMFAYKGGGPGQTGRLRAFAPLCPQKWATIALAYIKEVDYIQSKRLEIAKKAAVPPPPAPGAPNPKKKGKYQKAKAEAAADQE